MRNILLGAIVCLLSSGYLYAQDSIEAEIEAIENGLLPPGHLKGEEQLTFNIYDRMNELNVIGLSVAVLKDGELRWAKGYGMANLAAGDSVTTETLFQAGSISKPLAALSVLKLVQEGKLDLDTDVNEYLRDWKVKKNKFTKEKPVTLRLLLTHSAGMTVHGFPGYKQSDKFPSIKQVLKGKGNTDKIYVDTEPDTKWRYSGGGYTVMEKVVEDVTGMPLEEYMEAEIFEAMEMPMSNYEQPLTEKWHAQASLAYNGDGEVYEGGWHNYPEQAAAGLWTTPSELVTYYQHIQKTLSGEIDGLFDKEILEAMLVKHKSDWGLGPSLSLDGDSLVFGHGGKNAGFTNNMSGYAYMGDAIIVMSNSDNAGIINGEISRAISKYYDLDLFNQQIVERELNQTVDINKAKGTFKYIEEVPGIGTYRMDLNPRGTDLEVLDQTDGIVYMMIPIEDGLYMDMKSGERLTLTEKEDGSIEYLWNNTYLFIQDK